MRKLIVFLLIGFFAQLVDGSLGMAYGVTSTSLLLFFGVAPAIASASVHMAEVITTAASGISHIRFGNVDKKTVYRLIVPGMIGAFIGACFLSNLPSNIIKPYIAVFLAGLGVYIFLRFLFVDFQRSNNVSTDQSPSKKLLIPLGFVAGFIDSTGGGGWGPVVTPSLLTNNQLSPRKVIGSVDTSEFAIAAAATLGFVLSLGVEKFHWQWVLALMLGGIVAAPIAAWFVRKIPSVILGVLVGGLIILTNLKTILSTFEIGSPSVQNMIYLSFSLVWISAIGYTIYGHLQRMRHSK